MNTLDTLQKYLEDNITLLELPIVVDKGRDVFGELFNRWKKYLKSVRDAGFPKSCIAMIDKSIQLLTKAKQQYFANNHIDALSSVAQLVDDLSKENQHLFVSLDDLFLDGTVDYERFHWFRARTGGFYPYSKNEMKHIPGDMRSKIGSNRYNFNGSPCLYLGNSIYACWEELNRPSLDSLWVSRFMPNETCFGKSVGIRPLKLLNLSITGFDLVHAPHRIKYVKTTDETYEQAIIEYFSTWILQSACSIQVKEQNRDFKEEYIIPQLLMMTIQKFNTDGIIYFSTKVPKGYFSDYAWISRVIAIPALDLEENPFSQKIDTFFDVTSPINVGMYAQHLLPSFTPFSPKNENMARKHARIPISSFSPVYCNTIFYACENELLQSYYE